MWNNDWIKEKMVAESSKAEEADACAKTFE